MTIIWTDGVKNEKVLLRVKGLNVIKIIGHFLRMDCLQHYVIEGKLKVTGRQGRRGKQLLDNLKETRSS
jgi:hypothetical protein